MSSNIEICLEELDARPDDECFIRCVAVSGGQPGLALDRDGLVRRAPRRRRSPSPRIPNQSISTRK